MFQTFASLIVLVEAVVVFLVTAAIFQRRHKKRIRNQSLRKEDWQKDVVYIVQFPPSPHIRTISPFALKLETWLRLHQIKYECIYSLKFSRKDQIPYIEFNGQQYPDSNEIITFLTSHFGLDGLNGSGVDYGLSDEQRATAHAFTLMLEKHTTLISFYWRYYKLMPEFYAKLIVPHYPKVFSLRFFFRHIQPYITRFALMLSTLDRHSDDELIQYSCQDLAAISIILGDNKYFFGPKLTSIDCILFGHLVQFVYLPVKLPQQEIIKREYPNLVAYVDRVRDRLWPDWTASCNPQFVRVI